MELSTKSVERVISESKFHEEVIHVSITILRVSSTITVVDMEPYLRYDTYTNIGDCVNKLGSRTYEALDKIWCRDGEAIKG